MSTGRPDEFYVGYSPRAPRGLAQAVRVRTAMLYLAVTTAAVLLTQAHGLRPAARFEYGTEVELAGTLVERPYVHLIVPRPGRVGSLPAGSSYPLVAPWKHGADALVAGLDGQSVRLRATLVYRDGWVVAELVPGSLAIEPGIRPVQAEVHALGRHTLVGEIVDSKCFFGVMSPGEQKSHRACAVRCISGGIPPVLCVRGEAGAACYLMLVSADGHAVNQAVLDFVAEPVEISGEIERHGEVLVLFADPASYRRLE